MKIIYDGDCPVCLSLKQFAESKNSPEFLQFIPYQAESFSENAAGLTQQQASQALFAISEDGFHTRGARAVFEVMQSLPGFWRVVGKILSIPPLAWLAEPAYRLFARHRHKISLIYSSSSR